MIVTDEYEEIFNTARKISMEAGKKKALLEKNRFTICNADGSIPEKYRTSFKKLQDETDAFLLQKDRADAKIVELLDEYIQYPAMGNLYFEKNVEGTQYFIDVYLDILQKNMGGINKAVAGYDFDGLNSVIDKMCKEFLDRTLTKYVSYSKNLSFNKEN